MAPANEDQINSTSDINLFKGNIILLLENLIHKSTVYLNINYRYTSPMPEGPECRYIAQSLHGICQGSTVDRLDIFSGRYLRHGPPEGWKEFTNELTDNAIKLISIASHGKFLYWKFSNNWYLWNTLGMSGQWSLQGEADDDVNRL